MAVVKMSRFSAIGLDTAEDVLITQLMDFGTTELSNQDHKLTDEQWASLVSKEGREAEVAGLDSKLNAADNALKTLNAYDTAKKPLFSLRRVVTDNAFSSVAHEKAAIEANINEVLKLSSRLKELKSTKNKMEADVAGLIPWTAHRIPLELQETKYTYVLAGVVPPEKDISRMQNALEAQTDLFELSLIAADDKQQCVSLIYMKELEDVVGDILKQYDFSQVSFKDYKGSAEDNIARLNSGLSAIAKDAAETEMNLAGMVIHKDVFQLYCDYLTVERDRAKAFDNMLVTGRTFFIEGWIPTAESKGLALLLEHHGCHYEITEPLQGEETPVLLKNSKLITPIETITALYDTPSSKEVDPTPIFAFFYVCFFGIMFADIGYGLLLAALSYAAVKSGKLEGTASKFIKQLGYCGIATTIWGVVFGSFFGNIIAVASETFWGKTVSLKPLWINPVDEPVAMLIFACVCGVIHIFVALGVKAYSHIRAGRVLRAINDTFLWYVLIIGLVLLLAGNNLFSGAADIGKWMSIAGVAGILLLPAITGKGAGRFYGLQNIVGLTGYLSDVLSYARLLALCLAGSVIAQVFNILASLFGGGAAGAVMFILVSILAHTLNFLIGALGAFVHSVRLQYVEFFGKFFEGKGSPFAPFMKNTKYVKIVKEES